MAGVNVEFKRVKTGFVFSFKRPQWAESYPISPGLDSKGNSKGKVLEIVAQNPSATIPEIADALNRSTPGIEKIVRILKKENRLHRFGSAKGGHWEVVAS